MADYTDSLAAEDVPFERLDAAEVRRRWPQWHARRRRRPRCGRRRAGWPTRIKGNAAHRRLAPRPRRDPARERTPVTAIRDAGGGDLEVVTAGRAPTGRRRVVLAADAWTNGLLAPLRPSPAADRHQGAGHLLRLPRPGRLRAGPLPGLDLDGRPVLLRLPDLRRGGPEGRPGLRRRSRSTPDRARSSATRRRSRGVGGVHGDAPARARSGRRSTPRPASTR